ncbi:MAG: HD domain-containing protein [Desulfobacterales bacterium]|nr:HD domain-containing protein [Desulfobacterales bacterium]
MDRIADLLFEAKFLKELPRSGFPYLGDGRESVAEHSFMVAFLAYVMAKMAPETSMERLLAMCLLHDMPEARIGDLNAVHKKYVQADEARAVRDLCEGVPFGGDIASLIEEFNEGKTREARLAKDADQIALVLELKDLIDRGYRPAEVWMGYVVPRIRTEVGKQLLERIANTERDAWWLRNYIDTAVRPF